MDTLVYGEIFFLKRYVTGEVCRIWPTAVAGEADSVNSLSASACHIGGPKGVSPGQKALLHGTFYGSGSKG